MLRLAAYLGGYHAIFSPSTVFLDPRQSRRSRLGRQQLPPLPPPALLLAPVDKQEKRWEVNCETAAPPWPSPAAPLPARLEQTKNERKTLNGPRLHNRRPD